MKMLKVQALKTYAKPNIYNNNFSFIKFNDFHKWHYLMLEIWKVNFLKMKKI
jgi:hypothetical protein